MGSGLHDEIYARIREAVDVLEGVVHRTPLSGSMTLSRMVGGDVYLKLENLQKVGAFKVRGAYYKLWKEKARGARSCVTASSGNHAQGVAYSAGVLGMRATVYMPRFTATYKVEATRGYGAEVVLVGESYEDAYEAAVEHARREGAPFIHPFDDLDIVAGQGTIGVEIIEDLSDVDVILVPVGGGGLISGIAVAVKRLRPGAKVVGVQPRGAAAMCESFKRGEIVEVERPFSVADAVLVRRPGELTFKVVSGLVDDMVVVDDSDIARALFLLMERVKLVAEPAGALGVAAMLSGAVDVSGRKVVAVISGGNVDMSLLSEIIAKGLLLESRHIRIQGVLPDRPGQLKRVIDIIAEMNLNIVDVKHERGNPLVNPGLAMVTLEVEVPNREVAEQLVERLRKCGLDFRLVPPGE